MGVDVTAGPVMLLRVQDSEGRGPYRPGMSARWVDPQGFDCPPWWVELGMPMDAAHALMVDDLHWGCGFRSYKQFASWFTDREQRALDRLGYSLVVIRADRIIADTQRQTVFGSREPLSHPVRRMKLGAAAAQRLLEAA